MKDVKYITKKLPKLKVCELNQGQHIQVDNRFNYWPAREKWFDSVSQEKGRGRYEFIKYVKGVIDV